MIGLNDCAEIAYNNQFIDNIWKQFSQCAAQNNGLYYLLNARTKIRLIFIASLYTLSHCVCLCLLQFQQKLTCKDFDTYSNIELMVLMNVDTLRKSHRLTLSDQCDDIQKEKLNCFYFMCNKTLTTSCTEFEFRVNFNCLRWHWKINMSIKYNNNNNNKM